MLVILQGNYSKTLLLLVQTPPLSDSGKRSMYLRRNATIVAMSIQIPESGKSHVFYEVLATQPGGRIDLCSVGTQNRTLSLELNLGHLGHLCLIDITSGYHF